MDDALYSKQILRWTARLPEDRPLDDPDFTVTRTSRICGSRLRLDLRVDAQGRIVELGHQVKACAIGQAACAFFLAHLEGMDRTQAVAAAEAFRGLIQDGAPAPHAAPWDGLAIFQPVHAVRARHGAALLPVEALNAWPEAVLKAAPAETI